MSDVNTENSNKQSGWTSAAILAGTAIAAKFVLPVAWAVATFSLPLTGIAAVGAGVYLATHKEGREKVQGFLSKVGKVYKNAFSNLAHGFRKAEGWAKAKEAARTAAPEAAAGTSPLASKTAGAEFNASVSGVKPSAPVNENKPAPKPTALGM